MKFNTDQKYMFYLEGHKVVCKTLSDFIDKRHKERFKLMQEWHTNGAKDSDYETIVKFDAITDHQQKILEELLQVEWQDFYKKVIAL
jgi:hypothetical protein